MYIYSNKHNINVLVKKRTIIITCTVVLVLIIFVLLIQNSSEDAKGKFQEIGYAYKYLIEGPSAFETTNPHDVRVRG